MELKTIIVIGASAGGLEACKKIVEVLPLHFDAAVFIVIHIPARGISVLPKLFSQWGPLPAVHPIDGDPLQPGVIYVAPPNRHMLVKPHLVRLVSGPYENNSRPSVDPLFRSAAWAYGKRVIGVILSGNLDDGTAGLKVVKRRGGIIVVQDPEEAAFKGMPESAVESGMADYILPLDEIGPFLVSSVESEQRVELSRNNPDKSNEKDILELTGADLQDRVQSGTPTGFTCPECGGVLWEQVDDDSATFRCRVGHGFSVDYLEDGLAGTVEAALWNAVRVLVEKEQIEKKLAERMKDLGISNSAQRFLEEAKKASLDASLIRELIVKKYGSETDITD